MPEGRAHSSTRERTFGSCVTKSPWLEQFFSGSELQSTCPVRPWTTKEPKETLAWHHSKKAKRTTWRAREKEGKKLGACVLGSSMEAAVELAYCLESARCSVFKKSSHRSLSLSRSSTRNACEQPVQLHRGPSTDWLSRCCERESATDLLPHTYSRATLEKPVEARSDVGLSMDFIIECLKKGTKMWLKRFLGWI